MTTLSQYCYNIVVAGSNDPEAIKFILGAHALSDDEETRQLAWLLLKQVGYPLYSDKGLKKAAILAMELTDPSRFDPRGGGRRA